MPVDPSTWSTTPGSNTTVDGVNIAENCSPGGINNAIRAVMSGVRELYDDFIAFTATAITLTGVQTLTNKTLTAPAITTPTLTGTPIEDIYTITDGAAFEIDPANGSDQAIVLGANRTPKATNFQNGQAISLSVDDGTAYTITWTDATFGGTGVLWLGASSGGGTAPTLGTTGKTWITLWKRGGQVYGSLSGYSA
jgi:hypothetical protein